MNGVLVKLSSIVVRQITKQMKYQPGQHFILSVWYDKNCFENMIKL